MRCTKSTFLRFSNFLLFFLLSLSKLDCATVKDVFNLNTQLSARVPRDNKYYSGRYSSSSSNVSPLNRAIKPEDSPEAREGTQIPVEKRCTRCDSSYSDTRYPYESRSRYDDRRYSRDKYDSDDRRYDRYDDRRYYDRYDDRDRDRDRYDRYDKRPSYDRYDRDRYFDRFDRDRYDRDRPERDRYDRYDRDRYDRDYDRGFGYDNRGYDNRDRGWNDYQQDGSSGWSSGRGYYSGGRPESGSGYWGTGGGYASNWNYGGGRDDYRDREHYDYDGFKPWDETYRGTSGWDNNGRGYYFAAGVPEVGAAHWASRGEYTNNRKYGNNYRDRYYRSRDPYDGYKTSYLYGRPSSTTTDRPSNSGDSDSSVTQAPQQDSSSG